MLMTVYIRRKLQLALLCLLAAAVSPVPASAAGPMSDPLPDPLSLSAQWLNSQPLHNDNLRGKVVLVEFWSYGCINCLHTLPHMQAWAEKYRGEGLLVIGVHTPEFGYQKDRDNVVRAVRALGITYPVVMDNQYEIWNAYANNYWPALYLMDAQGRQRYRHIGEGAYPEIENMIRALLVEAQPGASSSRQ